MAWVNCCNSNLPPTWHFFSPQTTQLWSQTIQNAVSSTHAIVFDGFHQTAFRVWYELQVWYLLSVGVPFRGDHIGLRRNPLWKEVLAKKQPPEIIVLKKNIWGAGEKQPPENGPLCCLCRHCKQDQPVQRQGKSQSGGVSTNNCFLLCVPEGVRQTRVADLK